MGELRRIDGSSVRRLLPHHLVGRGPDCALRLDARYVSNPHALIRWQGRSWELLDRGSLNGTSLDGNPLVPGRAYPLTRGARICFGHPEETWLLAEVDPPETAVLDLDSGVALPFDCGLIGLPTSEQPECTLSLSAENGCQLEAADGSTRALVDGEVFEVGGRPYRLSLSGSSEITASLTAGRGEPAPLLVFRVSPDEDFVALTLDYGHRQVAIGSRAHNYLLLTLARQQLMDEAAGIGPDSAGWLDKSELAGWLNVTPQQIDGEVLRVRRHFARLGLAEANVVIERRPRTRQLRLGLRRSKIERL